MPASGPRWKRPKPVSAMSTGMSTPTSTSPIPSGRDGGSGSAVTSSQRCAAGNRAKAAYGLTTQTAIEATDRTIASAAAAPGPAGEGSSPASRGRTNSQLATKKTAQSASVIAADPSKELKTGDNGTGGVSGAWPTRVRNSASSSATKNGTVPAASQRSHGVTGS